MNDARYSMAVLFEQNIIGEEPGTARYDMAIRQATDELEQLARLATHPATAPAVFAWLVEAGVLYEGDESCDCSGAPIVGPGRPPWDAPWHYHYHAAMDHEKASGVGHG